MNPVLDNREQQFVDNIGLGMNPNQAARAAGYSKPSREAKRLLAKPEIHELVMQIQNETREKFNITRDKVMGIVLDAIESARLQADPMGMIRGAQELNKMNGYYEPEEKRLVIEGDISVIQKQISTMSDEELLEHIRDTQFIIEGEVIDDVDDEELIAQHIEEASDNP